MFRLTTLLTAGLMLQCALFTCLVYNPFVMDFLLAARGYGLALGFLSVALYVFARTVVVDEAGADGMSLRQAAVMSAYAGLSISANFAFAYGVGFLLIVAGGLTAARLRRQNARATEMLGFAAAFAFPPAFVLFVVAGSALAHFPREQLFWGSDSLRNRWRDIRDASFVGLNLDLVNPLLAELLEFLKRNLFRAFAVFGFVYLLMIAGSGHSLRRLPAKSRLLFAGLLTLTLTLAVAAHWLQWKALKIPLPLARIAVWFPPLATALVGTLLSIPPFHRVAGAVRGFGIGLLFFTGLYFVGELHGTYFREWRNDSDVRAAYPIVVDLCRRSGVREVAADQNWATSFNFYRDVQRSADIDELRNFDTIPADHDIYVLPEPQYGDFIRDQELEVVWRGPNSNMVVLARHGVVANSTSTAQGR